MTKVLRRSLGMIGDGPVRVLDALRWEAPFGHALRLWWARGVTAQDIPAKAGSAQLHRAMAVGQNLISSGTCVAGPLTLPFDTGARAFTPSVPETDLFQNAHVIVAQRLQEPADIALTWLRYHVAEQGMDAAVILDRSPPGPERERVAAKLAKAQIPGLNTLLLLDSPAPLGAPDRPAIGDPHTAPRADKRSATPNPWAAPLAEPLVYDILKWRFLARARGVAVFDLCDLAPKPLDEPDLFAAAARSHSGLITLSGEAVFPWRLRKNQWPSFGDHICRADPPLRLPRRWAVVPARCGPDSVWTDSAVLGHTPYADESAAYQRHMSVVFPKSPVQDLINKADLAEDAALLARAQHTFAAKPVRPPAKAKVAPAPLTTPATERIVIVTCMKNEGPFILEWLAYHQSIGVDDVLVYTNDCSDGTDLLLDLLQARGHVQRRDNPFRAMDLRPQHAALALAPEEPIVKQAGWLLPIDVDEFVHIHVGAGRFDDLLGALPKAQALSLTWRLFGNSDRDTYEDRFVTEQFTRCAPHLIRRPHQAWGFKTLYRNNGLFAQMGVHRPKGLARGAKVTWLNGSGQPMPRSIERTGWRSGIDSYGYDLVTLHHYAVRSAESFLVKRDRGRVNHVTRDQGEAYWFRMNNNAMTDDSIHARLPGARARFDGFLADPEIAAAHRACVAAHRTRIAELRADPAYAAFYAGLISPRMKTLSRLHRHFGMNVFLNGPSVIPDHLLDPPMDPNFFFNTAAPSGRAAD